MSNLIGQVLLNQFRVESFIAAGGMGAVYRVWDLKRNVPLAMKMLHAELAEDPSIYRKFKREATALRKLSHPNIVPFYGLHRTLEYAFLLEHFVDGFTLKQVLQKQRGNPMKPQEALPYLKALSAALGFAHSYGVVHCDVKPGNVMIDHGGTIYLTDFGIARHAESTVTTLGFTGTAAYMAPEQCRSEPVSAETDIYALGVILYEMLTGRRPFSGDEKETEGKGSTVAERIRYGHLHLPPPDPRSFNPEITVELAKVIIKALTKVPSNRYSSALDLYHDVCYAVGIQDDHVPSRVEELGYEMDRSMEGVRSQAHIGKKSIEGSELDIPTSVRKGSLQLLRDYPWVLGMGGLLVVILIIMLFAKNSPGTATSTSIDNTWTKTVKVEGTAYTTISVGTTSSTQTRTPISATATTRPSPTMTASPTPKSLSATIIYPEDGADVGKEVYVTGVIYGFKSPMRAFMCIKSTVFEKLTYPQGEIFPDSNGQWEVRGIYQEAVYDYETFVVATDNRASADMLAQQYYRANGMKILPEETLIISPIIIVTRR